MLNLVRSGIRDTGRKRETMRRASVLRRGSHHVVTILLFFVCSVQTAYAQDDMIKYIEQKRAELHEKEESLKREEVRIAAYRKEVDQRIEHYNQLLARLEAVLKKIENVKSERIDNLVKAYEAMPAEDAASRLTVLDRNTALAIIQKMKSKKIGAVLAVMDRNKAAELTKSMMATPNGN